VVASDTQADDVQSRSKGHALMGTFDGAKKAIFGVAFRESHVIHCDPGSTAGCLVEQHNCRDNAELALKPHDPGADLHIRQIEQLV
jgi:hypothetical protein